MTTDPRALIAAERALRIFTRGDRT